MGDEPGRPVADWRRRFEYFYGFIGGEANQYYPTLYEGTTPVEPKKTPEEGYHFMEDMTDKAGAWIAQQKALAPDKPLFVYFAPGATHAPHHVPKEWPTSTRASSIRAGTSFARKRWPGKRNWASFRQTCLLTARYAEIPAWHDTPDALKPIKPILWRQMEVYAGFLEFIDHHVGRLLDGLRKLNVLDDTLVHYG